MATNDKNAAPGAADPGPPPAGGTAASPNIGERPAEIQRAFDGLAARLAAAAELGRQTEQMLGRARRRAEPVVKLAGELDEVRAGTAASVRPALAEGRARYAREAAAVRAATAALGAARGRQASVSFARRLAARDQLADAAAEASVAAGALSLIGDALGGVPAAEQWLAAMVRRWQPPVDPTHARLGIDAVMEVLNAMDEDGESSQVPSDESDDKRAAAADRGRAGRRNGGQKP